MLTVNKLIPQARGLAPVLTRRAAHLEIDWDVRQRSRFDATDSSGRQLGVFLPRGTVVRGGDVLVADDGSLIVVQAAAQPVLVVTVCADHGSPFDLLRAAYHLGNRHVALELQPDRLQLEPDHVLADLLRQMHLIVHEANAAFEPESGAYAAAGPAHATGAHSGHAHGAETQGAHAHAGDAATTGRGSVQVREPNESHERHEPHGSHDRHDRHERHERHDRHEQHEQHDHGHHDVARAAPTHDRAPAGSTAAPAAPAAVHVHGPGCRHEHGG